MKTKLLKLALGLTVAALGALPASAGDYGGGLKGLRGSYVPVPAPNPVPDYKAKYYLRADLGVGFNIGAGLSERGAQYGVNEGAGSFNAINPFGYGSSPEFTSTRTEWGHDVGYSFDIGAGYYFTNNFRMDLTFGLREEKLQSLDGSYQYRDDANNDGVLDPPPGETDWVQGEVRDRFRLRSGIFLANAYYDVGGWGKWRPYVGGGLGFSVNEVERRNNRTYTLCAGDASGPTCPSPTAAGSNSASSDLQYTYSLAAQLTAGVSYEVWENTHLDFNYRYLYVGGTDSGLRVGGRTSMVEIDDQHEHYLRAGLRWDLN